MNILILGGDENSCRRAQSILTAVAAEDSYTFYTTTWNGLKEANWLGSTVLLCLAEFCEIRSEETGVSGSDQPVGAVIDRYLQQGGRVLVLGCRSGLSLGSQVISSRAVEGKENPVLKFVAPDLSPEPAAGEKFWESSAAPAGSEQLSTCSELVSYNLTGTSGEVENLVVCEANSQSEEAVPVAAHVIFRRNGSVFLCGFHADTLESGLDNMFCRKFLASALTRLGLKCRPTLTSRSQSARALTPAYIYCSDTVRHEFLDNLSHVLRNGVCKGDNMSLEIRDATVGPASEGTSVDIEVREDLIPVIFAGAATSHDSFNVTEYRYNLSTATMGRTLMYSEVTTSTQAILNKNYSFSSRIPANAGLVFVATHQTHGKGRRDNQWVSPLGCLQFSAHLPVPSGTPLAQHLTFLQYMCSLAVVQGVCSLPGYKDLDLRLKWPNDIYFGRDTKIGGVLVDCSTGSSGTSAVIGCGVNVSNSKPTTCINDIIRDYNEKYNALLEPLSMEIVLALTMNCFEQIIRQFQQHGVSAFTDEYYERWLHSGARVTLGKEAGEEEVVISGLDEAGYLRVRRKNGEMMSVQPDGNSFDMMRGLLVVRKP